VAEQSRRKEFERKSVKTIGKEGGNAKKPLQKHSGLLGLRKKGRVQFRGIPL